MNNFNRGTYINHQCCEYVFLKYLDETKKRFGCVDGCNNYYVFDSEILKDLKKVDQWFIYQNGGFTRDRNNTNYYIDLSDDSFTYVEEELLPEYFPLGQIIEALLCKHDSRFGG